MPKGSTTLDASEQPKLGGEHEPPPEQPALIVIWTSNEPAQLGQSLSFERPGPFVFGRGDSGEDDPHERIFLTRQRPGRNHQAPPMDNPFLSRCQLRLQRTDGGLDLDVIGKRPLCVSGGESSSARVVPGDIVEIKGLVSFYCTLRPAELPSSEYAAGAFGEADAHGIVGESPATWELRNRIEFYAGREAHVLISGESGTGKELVARALHALSTRAKKTLVARNSATLPSGLVDAELFGNVANYPHHGLPERPGLVGEASGSTLFLDEVGELSADLQAHLLRLLDSGEYHRLGEASARAADIRFLAATNRNPEALKHDLSARFGLRIELDGLAERREDIPLIARHLLKRAARRDPALGQRFFANWDGHDGEPRTSPELMRALVLFDYRTHARELEALLWRSLAGSRGGFLDLTPELRDELASHARMRPVGSGREVTAEEIRAALARHSGVKDRVWRELGLPNRHVLRRLIHKYGIDTDPAEP